MIRAATLVDQDAIWTVIEPVIRAGETYAIDRDISREDALAYWMGTLDSCFVAEVGGTVIGTYYLRANQSGGGRHVSNCGYIVAANARGQGIAKSMCEHSLRKAALLGFKAMQFNFVVSTNVGAVKLWETLGFTIIGRLPDAFESPSRGSVDALIMFRTL